MKTIIATLIAIAPLLSNAYSETDRVTLAQKASALGQLAEASGPYFILSAQTKYLLTALVSGQKQILREGIRVTVLKTVCSSGTAESSCDVEIGVQSISSGESAVIAINYAIEKNGIVTGASQKTVAE